MDFTPRHLRNGNNSGYAALNVVAQLEGVRTMVLLGFDMCVSPTSHPRTDGVHWHSGYPIPTRSRALDNMLPNWSSLVGPLAEHGLTVINASEVSKITCFPKMSVDDALHQFSTEEVADACH